MHIYLCHLDGLVDCLDPDCCLQTTCQSSLLCRGSRDPLDIIQQSQSGSPAVKSFYDRIKLLVGKDSTHIIPGDNPFNSRYKIERLLWIWRIMCVFKRRLIYQLWWFLQKEIL